MEDGQQHQQRPLNERETLPRIRGRRFIDVPELEENNIFNEDVLRHLIGNDRFFVTPLRSLYGIFRVNDMKSLERCLVMLDFMMAFCRITGRETCQTLDELLFSQTELTQPYPITIGDRRAARIDDVQLMRSQCGRSLSFGMVADVVVATVSDVVDGYNQVLFGDVEDLDEVTHMNDVD